MSIYKNREALYSAYLNSEAKAWQTHISELYVTLGADDKLYYLSLDGNLEGTYEIGESFEDKSCNFNDYHQREIYTVVLPPRLLAHTSIEGAWNQMFKKLKYIFRSESNFDTPLQLHLYEVNMSDCQVIDDRTLCMKWLVHNAHVNGTHAVFGQPVLKKIKHLSVQNTLNYPDESCTYYNPFNYFKYDQDMLSTPLVILDEYHYNKDT